MTVDSDSIRRALRPDSDPYASGKHSYFADLVKRAADQNFRNAAIATGADRLGIPDLEGHIVAEDWVARQEGQKAVLPPYRARLSQVQKPRADMTTSDTDGGEFIPAGASTRVQDAFAESVKARSVVAPLLRNLPLPEFGQSVEEPRISTGPSVAIGTAENTAIEEQDAVTEEENDAVETISGAVDMSRQAFDRSSPELDQAIASELGGLYAELLDAQIVNGSGSDQLQGLLGVSGITAVTYTDVDPTPAEAFPKILQTVATTATAWKNTIPIVLAHERRSAWLYSVLGSAPVFPPGVRLVDTAAIPTTLGAGTEDAVITLDPLAVKLYTQAPQFRISFDTSGSGTGTVKVWVYGYAAFGSSRQPAAIGKLTGTGLAAPVFA